MKKIQVNLSKTEIPEKIQIADDVIAKMTGNALFPNPHPDLSTMNTLTRELEQSYQNARDKGIIATTILKQKESAFDRGFRGLTAYVEYESQGDEAQILSSGLILITRALPAMPVTPTSVIARPGNREGEVIMNWPAVKGAKVYRIEISTDDMKTWTEHCLSARQRIVLSGLESGARVAFRVAAFGAEGQTNWSTPCQVRVS